MGSWQFQERLKLEFETRQRSNARYSLRAFAAFLETDHSTLSQILRGTRRIPVSRLRRWGKKLGMTGEEVAVYVAAQYVPEQPVAGRQEQIRHWTAEAFAIVTDHTHWQIVRLVRLQTFQADCRWIARQIGVHVDQVNVALSRLLRLRLLEIGPSGRWRSLPRSKQLAEAEFRKRALIKVRELAAQDGIKLRRPAKKST